MSMEKSPAATSGNWSYPGTGRLPPSQAWQVPTFLAGVLALALVAAARPLWSVNPEQQLVRDLAAARRALEHARPDLEQAVNRAELALSRPGIAPVQAAEAHFLLGSAHLRRSESMDTEAAHEVWQLARAHLERAEQLGVPTGDTVRLAYRLGKTYFKLNEDPPRVVEYLARSAGDRSDDAFESYGLLAQAYLRLTPPDNRAALDALQKQLALPQVNERLLAQPRLLCGELYRRLDQLDEARKVLARIGPTAPADILFQARVLRARTLQDQGLWSEAALVWEQLKADPRATEIGAGPVWYAIGLCYSRLDRPVQAQEAWEEAQKHGGEEAQAAALGLAGLRLQGGRPASALEAFESAVKDLAGPEAYRNKLVELPAAQALFEAGHRTLMQAGNFDAALQLAQLYEKLAAPGLAAQLAGQAAEAWGHQFRAQAASFRTRPPAARSRTRPASGSAAPATPSTSRPPTGPAPEERAELLWRSAANYLEGHAPASALPVLEKFVALPLPKERLGEAWYVRGEAFRQLNNHVAARADYRHCISFPGPFAFRARYQLALYHIEQNDLAEAEDILNQNLSVMDVAPVKDAEAHEKTLYTLANLLFLQRDYPKAIRRYEEALERYPGNALAGRARFQLGQCYRNLAQQCVDKMNGANEEERRHWRVQAQRALESAALNFEKLAAELTAARKARSLAADEELLARQAAFAFAECQFDLGQYPEALRLYEELATRFANQVDGLIALRHVWQLHGLKFQPDQARRALDQINDMLAKMPDGAFDQSAEIRTRRWWEEWLREKRRTAP